MGSIKEVEEDAAIDIMLNLSYSFMIPKPQGPGASQRSFQDEFSSSAAALITWESSLVFQGIFKAWHRVVGNPPKTYLRFLYFQIAKNM